MLHFWNNKDTVIEADLGSADIREIIGLGYTNLFCVNPEPMMDSLRYGYYDLRGSWHPIPIYEFPKAFRMQLLLRGVET